MLGNRNTGQHDDRYRRLRRNKGGRGRGDRFGSQGKRASETEREAVEGAQGSRELKEGPTEFREEVLVTLPKAKTIYCRLD